MTREVFVEKGGPGVTVQDLGRPGRMGIGLSRGGAADRCAILKGAALLGQTQNAAAFELTGPGARFRFGTPCRIALTGATMVAGLDGQRLEPRAAYQTEAGSVLTVGPATAGVYGYLHVGGGIATSEELESRSFHRIAEIGQRIGDGDRVPLGEDPAPEMPLMRLPAEEIPGGPLRVIPGPQTGLFPEAVRNAFETTEFTRSPRGNRQGVRFDHDGGPFSTGGQLTLVSDFIAEGDIQMTGDGTPFVLLAECQTMGGYPRIGTVIPADIPRVAQAEPGARLQFNFISLEEAERLWVSDEALLVGLREALCPRTRDPREMSNLLSYELIGRPDPDVTG